MWTYPSHAILGPVLYHIPVEELFFFVIQTYGTSFIYLLVSKPTLHPACLPHKERRRGLYDYTARHYGTIGIAGQALLIWVLVTGARLVSAGGTGTYMGLILIWALPFVLLLW